MARQIALPPNLPPRLIGREAAAAYVAVAPATFDKMMRDRIMPAAKRLSEKRHAWDVRELDTAVDLLPADAATADDDHSWDDVDAA